MKKKFYETVFETTLADMVISNGSDPSMKMFSFPSTMEPVGYGASGALVKMEGMKPGGNSTIIYLGSEDCATEEARVEAAGGKVVQSKTDIAEYGFIVLAVDTEGNTFGIHSMK